MISQTNASLFKGQYLGPIRLSNFENELVTTVVWM